MQVRKGHERKQTPLRSLLKKKDVLTGPRKLCRGGENTNLVCPACKGFLAHAHGGGEEDVPTSDADKGDPHLAHVHRGLE